MKPLFVRELSDPERHALQAGLRSSDGFTVRRCHILLASARGNTTTVIAQAVGCSPQAVRNVLRAFETRGLAVVAMQSRRPHTAAKVFDTERSERLKALLHQSPRQSGKARSTWTLALAAEVCAEHGITAERVSLETIRDALKRLGVGWRRAKTWITSPDPQDALKRMARPPDCSGGPPPRLGGGLCRRGLVEPLGAAGPARLGRDAATARQCAGEGRCPTQGSGGLRAVAHRPGSGAAALCRGAPSQPRDHHLLGLGCRPETSKNLR